MLPGVSLVEALVLSIMLACTDAALGQAVVTDERIPSRIRQGLNVESGLNDGICVPLFFIALALAEWDEGALTAHAAVHLVLEEIGYGLVAGVAAGILGALALRVAARRSLVEPHWLQILTVCRRRCLAAGIATGLGGSIFIAAFTAGFLFGVVGRDSGGEVSYLVDEGGELLNAVTFIVFGAAILGPALDELGWEVLAYAVLSLTVVRMLPVALSLLGTRRTPPDGRVRGLVRPAWPRDDRLRRDHDRRVIASRTSAPCCSPSSRRSASRCSRTGSRSRPLTNRYVGWYASHPREAAAADGERARGLAPLAQAASTRGTRPTQFTVNDPSGGRVRRRPLIGPMTLVWITILRGVMAIVLGLALALNGDRAPAALVNFMGIYWTLNGIITLRLGMALQGARRRLAITAGAVGIATGATVLFASVETPSCSRSSVS